VTDRASANGFSDNEDANWANFGQGAHASIYTYRYRALIDYVYTGAPEVGPIPGGSERPTTIDISAFGQDCLEYSPTTGARKLRTAVADLYNEMYRKEKDSKYTFKVRLHC